LTTGLRWRRASMKPGESVMSATHRLTDDGENTQQSGDLLDRSALVLPHPAGLIAFYRFTNVCWLPSRTESPSRLT
jgi:hypothetical protein